MNPDDPSQSAIREPPDSMDSEPRWQTWAWLLGTLVAIHVAMGPKVFPPKWSVPTSKNSAVAEGEAWLAGRLDIPTDSRDPLHHRMHDTAIFDGKVYNVFPPLASALTVALSPLKGLFAGRDDYRLHYTMLAFWPLPILGFLVFRRQVRHSPWAALLTAGWIGGTSLLPVLHFAGQGLIWHLNHAFSQIGLILLAGDLLGRRRIWPALVGLAIATWSRQMTVFYAIPLLWEARKQRRLPLCAAGLVVIVGPLLTLNYVKFKNPLDFGYRYVYDGLAKSPDDALLAERCRTYGVFSTHFIPENAYYMLMARPKIEPSLTGLRFRDSDPNGASILITTPILIFVLWSAPTWLRDGPRRRLMLGTLPVLLGILCYHATGFSQQGYYRFALDFIPIWLAVIAGQTRGGRRNWRSWLAATCTIWSLLYFQATLPEAGVGANVSCAN